MNSDSYRHDGEWEIRDITETLQTNLEIRVDLPSLISCDLVDEDLIDAIYNDLEGRVNRDQIWQTACEEAERYHDASITTFIPIFIRRQTIEIMARKTLLGFEVGGPPTSKHYNNTH